MRWAEIVIELPSDSVEAATGMLLEAGCHGVAQSGGDYCRLVGFLPVSDQLSAILDPLEQRLRSLPEFDLPAPDSISLRYSQETDWANEWKKYFHAMEIGDRLVIKPSWEEYDRDPERVIVEIDPGQAFGTGGHATTRLCLSALDAHVRPGMAVADIGTGSGILAIAAAKLGAARVHATDIDSLPRKVARENVERNGLSDLVTIHEMEEFDAAAQSCDLVVANIIAVTVIELMPSIFDRLKPGGLFIASGIVDDRLADVYAGLEATGFILQETLEDEIWRATVSRRP